jgi:hypothetical protein
MAPANDSAEPERVVLVGFAATVASAAILAPAQTDPINQLQGTHLGAFRPVCDEIHDRRVPPNKQPSYFI